MRKTVPIKTLKPHPENPRVIRSKDFDHLVESLRNFPEMLRIRPIVCNLDHVVLGGNQRLEAVKELGWKHVEVEIVDLDQEKQKEFLIKDNNSAGSWNMDMIANEWDLSQLYDWGFDLPAEPDQFEPLDFNPERTETESESEKCECCGK